MMIRSCAPLVGALVLAAAPAAWACSTCLCGDYTLTLMGSEKFYSGRTRLGIETLSREESQGRAGLDQRVLEEQRYLLGASYAFSERYSLALRLPYVIKEFNDSNGARQEGSGLGDAELLFKAVLAGAETFPSRDLFGVQLGLRAPTGREERTGNGQRLDMDAQPGTGAWAPIVGVWYGRYRYPWTGYASLVVTDPNEGDQGFDAGLAVVPTLSAQYAVSQLLSLSLGVESRWSEANRYDGVEDPDSGGFVAFAVPGLSYAIAPEMLISAAVQLPGIENGRGDQSEDGDIRLALVWDLPTE